MIIINVLAFDPSSKATGYGIVIDNKLITYGFIKKTKDKNILNIYNKLEELITTYQIDIIVKEDMFVGGNARTGITLASIHGIIQLLSEKHAISLNGYPVMTIKSTVLNGIKRKNPDGTKKTGEDMKKEVAVKVNNYFGTNITNLDVTDALSVYLCFKIKVANIK